MQHSPSPWRFDHDWGRLPTIFAADGKTKVAIIEKIGRHEKTPQQEADARLIEAAPTLKTFLEIALDAYEDEHGAPCNDRHFVNRARKLLARLEE